MKQLDVLDYVLLLGHNCYNYKTKDKEDGTYYYIRKRDGDKRKIAIIYPTKGDSSYTCGSVCNICTLLDVPVPEYGKKMQGRIDKAKSAAQGMSGEQSDENNAPK